jgi:prephenate dehydrogenase
MTVQITIIGLGQIGTSLGLALKEHTDKIHRVGHDRVHNRAQQAKNLGAVDQLKTNLHNAVKDADIVLLALPLSEIKTTLELIGNDLRPGTVVMETAPAKAAVANWVEELLSPSCDYIGLLPTIHPAHLLGLISGQSAAHENLFRDAPMLVVSPPVRAGVETSAQSTGRAIKAASDLAKLVGAKPLFIDIAETDGLITATHILPRLMAAALVNITIGQPGWQEGTKLTGRVYTEATAPVASEDQDASYEAESLLTASVMNKGNVLRVMDKYIFALQSLRDDVVESSLQAGLDDKSPLYDYLMTAYKVRQRWWQERNSPDWGGSIRSSDTDIPETSLVTRLFGGEFLRRDKKKK